MRKKNEMEPGVADPDYFYRNSVFTLETLLRKIAGYLDPRSLLQLPATGKFFWHFFEPRVILEFVRLPVTPKFSAERVFSQLLWFLSLPPFAEPESRFPFFRFRGGEARLVQGALRSLRTVSTPKGRELVASIQPSQNWNKAHDIHFRILPDKLAFQGCRCRNG